jgi:hypothetical protein
VEKSTAEALQHFRLSNNNLQIYLGSVTGSINERAYHSAVGNCVELGDWRGAIEYLQLLVATGTLNERAKGEAKIQLKRFEENLRRKGEAELERELDRGRDRTPLEPAN